MSLDATDYFAPRHIGPRPEDRDAMLAAMGVGSLDELIDETIPQAIRAKKPLTLQPAESESRFLERLRHVAARNTVNRSYIGMGYYDCITPSVILRNVLENPGWYTPYTPYQAEIAQGRLEALLNFQTVVTDLTGMDMANASLLDEATAAAEAMTMAHRIRNRRSKTPVDTFVVTSKCFPQTLDVLRCRAEPLGIKLVVEHPSSMTVDEETFGVFLQYPDCDGAVADLRPMIQTAHDAQALVVVATDLLALSILTPPGEMGADMVVGSAQRFGVPMGYGGPHAAFFATREDMMREMPGRIIGISVDAHGQPAYRMALQTREQHIRREKAKSNICTAQALLASIAGLYAVYHGPDGLRAIAQRVHTLARALADELSKLGYAIEHEHFFDTVKVDLTQSDDAQVHTIRTAALKAGINFHYLENAAVQISLDETTSTDDVQKICRLFGAAKGEKSVHVDFPKNVREDVGFPDELRRTSTYLQHDVFNKHRSETEMMRYIRSLERKDVGLDTSMIPLGSCTMKLNAATEMMPVTWPEFARMHPFAPIDQTEGYQTIFDDLERALCEITGFAGVSLQPNSGAQGEYAGLMVIRAYHRDVGDLHRDVVLIPASAHGTNPATAVLAGMKVVVVKCDDEGNIDVADLSAKAEQHAASLAALMITYPSTHGVFEESVQEICSIVHGCGGQVYMDGANLNAQVGLTSPAMIGADVCHINLHKTFSIPHGGGGPGMGPIAVASHLVPFLPGHVVIEGMGGDHGLHAVSAAPWGSAAILLISYAYICMLGAEGCTEATRYAILNANYIKARLESHYDILYTGPKGRVAHEMIFDLRPFKESGINETDVAKRLMDYGFHAPTVSWPVPGTMMIEPTESEPKEELDRFCDALIAIHQEIQDVLTGKADKSDNVLKNAPHTAAEATSDTWSHPYSREQAVYPLPFVKAHKFWPSVGRIDNPYGDRNLVCSCAAVESYTEEPQVVGS